MTFNKLLTSFPLTGIRVLELAGLAPVPFAGMVLADFGATVTRVDRIGDPMVEDYLARGKRSVSLDLKSIGGREIFRRLCKNSDVLIEPFRPGVMEKLYLGPEELLKLNEELIYVRLNGYGSQGDLANTAGHDINYLGISGVLSKLGRKEEKPTPPLNLLGDFAGGSMIAVMGVLLALLERQSSRKGQVVNTSITEGASYISSFLNLSHDMFIWLDHSKRGVNLLDTGAPFYDTYETKDGKYLAVGALENKFYQDFVKGLDMVEELKDQQLNIPEWPQLRNKIAQKIKSKTQSEWIEIYSKYDACVTPVLNLDEAHLHETNIKNNSFMKNPLKESYEPSPAPKLSRTPGVNYVRPRPNVGEHTVEVLQENGFSIDEIDNLIEQKYVYQYKPNSSL